jgi:cell division protein FtsW
MLILLLIPGIGHEVNGSMRWISVGPINVQVSEFAKMGFFIYLAAFVSHQQAEHISPSKLILGLIPAGLVSVLILLQPDFGAVVVIMACSLGLLFIAGMPLWQFSIMVFAAIGGFAMLAITSPYRFVRLTTFMNPWEDQFDSGYQLTQALIAFGRGHWFGSGLGSGVQKMLYLPEAHTDFIYAVIAEELGLVGSITVLILYSLLVWQGFRLARQAYTRQLFLQGNLAYMISLWLALQSLIAMGVNTGLLPTKGLTLPLLSYGGSSLWVSLFAVMVLLRINKELR